MKLVVWSFVGLVAIAGAGCGSEATTTEAAEVLCPCISQWFGDGSPCDEEAIEVTAAELDQESQACLDCIAESESCEALDEGCESECDLGGE